MTNKDIKFISSQKDGRLIIEDKISFLQEIKKYQDRNFLISVEPIKNKRTIKQNAYYWGGVIGTLCQTFEGHTSQEMHELMKIKHLSKEIQLRVVRKGIMIEENIIVSSETKTLSTTEFNEYIERIRQWALEYYECYIPTPEEYFKKHNIDI